MSIFNINEFARSFYKRAVDLNSEISEKIGLETYWMRSIPSDKGSDIIFHEYTLYDVACPVKLKVITNNSAYNPGNFNLDLFGIDYESPLEIEIDKDTWQKAFSGNVMPQKGDIVFITILNCLFEVSTSTILYGFAEIETGFKIELQKYTPRTNRREDGVKQTLNDMTVGESELFGDKISEEVADIVDKEQLDQHVSTFQNDNYKICDIKSIVMEDVGFANSYYNLNNISQSIIYKISDNINTDSSLPYRYFSCHFCINDKNESSAVKLENEVPRKDGTTTFEMNTTLNMINGQKIDFTRGSSITIKGVVSGTVENNSSTQRYLISFSSADVAVLKRKFTNWYTSALRATKSSVTALLLGKTSGNTVFNISIIGNKELYIKIGTEEKIIRINGGIPVNEWVGLGINIIPNGSICLFRENQDSSMGNMFAKTTLDMPFDKNIPVGTFYITSSNAFLTNIRLYKIDENVDDSIILDDLSSRLIPNDSIAIINDSAVVPNLSPYIGEMK